MASVFIANRLKSSSLLHDERILAGIVKSNISKNETLRHLSDSCLRSTRHRPLELVRLLPKGRKNDDPTGLSDIEIELIDGFMTSTFPHGCSVDWDTCQQPHFSLSPEFGQPGEVYDAVIYGY